MFWHYHFKPANCDFWMMKVGTRQKEIMVSDNDQQACYAALLAAARELAGAK
jgi:hypothetical protein